MSTLVGLFVSSPREREKRDIENERGIDRKKKNKNKIENEETEDITFPLYPYLLQGQ